MKKVYSVELVKPLTMNDCVRLDGIHHTWVKQINTSALYAVKHSETSFILFLNVDTKKGVCNNLSLPCERARELFRIVGEATDRAGKYVSKKVNAETYYN